MTVCRAGAAANEVLLYWYISKLAGKPTDKLVMFALSVNLINGGSHCEQSLGVSRGS